MDRAKSNLLIAFIIGAVAVGIYVLALFLIAGQ